MEEKTLNTGIEAVGTVQVIYTAEHDPENEHQAIVTYWLQNGQKLCSMTVQRGNPQ